MRAWIFTFALGLISGLAYGHDEDEHKPTITGATKQAAMPPAILKTVQDSYKVSVAPIFEHKCFDCHSSQGKLPWYYKVPGVKQLIDDDVEEGREHMEMSLGFPFASRHEVDHDLEDLAEEVGEGEMPPTLYVFMHGASKLTPDEKKLILGWIDSTQTLLKTVPK